MTLLTSSFLNQIKMAFAIVLLSGAVLPGCATAKAKKTTSKTASVYAPTHAAIVMDADTGKVLYSDNATALTQPASLTKMMTLLLAFEGLEKGTLKLKDAMGISRHATNQMPSKLGLKVGGYLTVKEAVFALITKSANDASVALAEEIGGTEHDFATLMNKKARQLGMYNTHFENASGVPNSKQLTTATDMAILSRYLHKNYPSYYKLFQTKAYNFRGAVHNNHNHLLGPLKNAPHIHVDGIKTGFVNASGFNLAASGISGNKRLIVVVLGGVTRHSRDHEVANLMREHFKKILPQKDKKAFVIDSEDLPELETAGMDELISSHAETETLVQAPSKVQEPTGLQPISYKPGAEEINVPVKKKPQTPLKKKSPIKKTSLKPKKMKTPSNKGKLTSVSVKQKPMTKTVALKKTKKPSNKSKK